MPTAATTGASPSQAANARTNGQGAALPVALVPFTRASSERVESSGIDVSRQLSASAQDFQFDVPAVGYLRSLVVLVEATGGTATGAAATEDGPWNVLQDIAVTEPNGAPIFSCNSGFELYLINKWGGYRPNSDPKANPAWSTVAAGTGNFSFLLRIPLEINAREALGSLPNQNAAATFKLRFRLAATATVLSGTITAAPTVRVRTWTEAWEQPAVSSAGAPNQIHPPAVNTTQFWSAQTYNVSQGEQQIRQNRVGQYIRNLIFILRDSTTPTRSDGEANWPDPFRLYLDARPVLELNKTVWKQYLYERFGRGAAGDSPGQKDNGVYVLSYTHDQDGSAGYELNDLWQPTLGTTRFEFSGNFLNSAGTLTVLTNDVAVAGSVWR